MAEDNKVNALEFDLTKLTMRDVVETEKMVGRPVLSALGRGELPADVLVALLTVIQRRSNPSATQDDILDLPLSALEVTSGNAGPFTTND